MFMVSDQLLCRTIHVKRYGNSSSRKLCLFIYGVPYCQQNARGVMTYAK